MKDLTHSFAVDATPEAVFAAIQNVRGWWGAGIEGDSEKLGDVFTYRHKELHYSRQKLVELVPGKKLVWDVLDDAYLSFTKNENEWKGTRLVFDISANGGKTEVRFTHVGLNRDHECYDACEKAWGHYACDSLRRLITKGTGEPDPKEYGLNSQLRRRHSAA